MFPDKKNIDDQIEFSYKHFPVLKLFDFKEQYRIPIDLPQKMVKDAVKRAYYLIVQELDPNIVLNEMQITFFARAVFCRAKAEILRETPSIMRAKAAENPAKFSEETEDVYLTLSTQALRALWNMRGSATIQLI